MAKRPGEQGVARHSAERHVGAQQVGREHDPRSPRRQQQRREADREGEQRRTQAPPVRHPQHADAQHPPHLLRQQRGNAGRDGGTHPARQCGPGDARRGSWRRPRVPLRLHPARGREGEEGAESDRRRHPGGNGGPVPQVRRQLAEAGQRPQAQGEEGRNGEEEPEARAAAQRFLQRVGREAPRRGPGGELHRHQRSRRCRSRTSPGAHHAPGQRGGRQHHAERVAQEHPEQVQSPWRQGEEGDPRRRQQVGGAQRNREEQRRPQRDGEEDGTSDVPRIRRQRQGVEAVHRGERRCDDEQRGVALPGASGAHPPEAGNGHHHPSPFTRPRGRRPPRAAAAAPQALPEARAGRRRRPPPRAAWPPSAARRPAPWPPRAPHPMPPAGR